MFGAQINLGYDESRALECAMGAALEIAELPPEDPEGSEAWQIRAGRVAFETARDSHDTPPSGSREMLERIMFQKGVQRIVSQPEFFPGLLASATSARDEE